MTLSRELRKRLNSEDVPLAKRLKLAENVFHSADLPIVRKEDIILEWICNLPTDENIWKTIKQCVQSKHFNIKQDVKEKLIDKCVEELSKEVQDVPGEKLECCNLLLSNSIMQQYFIDVPEKLGSFIKSILQYVDCFLEQHSCRKSADESVSSNTTNKDDIPKKLISNITVSTIENMVDVYKYSSNTRPVLKKVFIQEILHPLCQITRHKWDDDIYRVKAAFYKCIQLFIYGKHKFGYKSSDTDAIPDIFPDLCHVLSKFARKGHIENNLLICKFVLQTAIGFYKSNPALLDHILREVLNAAGQYKKQVLNPFFCDLKDVPFNFDNKIKDITLEQYLHQIIDDVLLNEHLTAIDYEILSGFAYFNPLIIADKIPQILVKVYLEEKVSENADLMIAILHANVKLRNEERFIPQLLASLKEAFSIKKMSNENARMFFPFEFQSRLTGVVSKITHSQLLNILNSLVNVLNDDCLALLNSDDTCKGIIMIRATMELIASFYNGIRFLKSVGTLDSHKMFANHLHDLGKVLSLFIDKALQLSYNDSLISLLILVLIKLNATQRLLNIYIPEAITEPFVSPISDDQWDILIQKVTDFGDQNSIDNLNTLMLCLVKGEEKSKPSFKLRRLIGDLNCAWNNVFKDNIELLPLLHRKEISKLIQTILPEILSDKNKFDNCLTIFRLELLQENRIFIATLIVNVLAKIGLSLTGSITANLIEHINNKDVIKAILSKNDNLINTLNLIKEDILKSEWCSMEESVSEQVVPYLKILRALPTKYLDINIRTLLFLVIYSVSRECVENEEVHILCDEILSGLLVKSAVDIHEIGPKIFLCKSRQSKAIPKALEHALKNVSSYEVLKEWVKLSENDHDSMLLLLECMANVRPRLVSRKKDYFEKAETKLFKSVLKTLRMDVISPEEVRKLTLLVRVSLYYVKRREELKEIANKTLHNIFSADDNSSEENSKELIDEGLELVHVMLKNPGKFPISTLITKQIWRAMLNRPHQNLLPNLLSINGPEEFQELLKLLQDQIVKSLLQNNEELMENSVIIWNAIMKCDMSARRKQLRSVAIDNFLQLLEFARISLGLWPLIVKFLNVTLGSRHLYISSTILDVILSLGLRSMREARMVVCNEALTLSKLLIKTRTHIMSDRLPALLLLYRQIIKEIVNASKDVSDKRIEHHCKCLALDFEKLTGSLIKMKKDMARLSPYLISDIINILSESPVPPFIRDPIENCINYLISICDQHALALLFRVLPVAMQELFKMYFDRFNKFHKYSGKV